MSNPKRNQASVKKLWIGLANVEQKNRQGVLGDADQAYTNAIGKAVSKADFRNRVKQELARLGLDLLRLQEAELLADRFAKFDIASKLRQVAQKAAKSDRVVFGTFHAYHVHDSIERENLSARKKTKRSQG
jgi:hypothetical protein